MAKHKLYIGDYGVSKMRLGDSRSTDYSYDPETSTLIIWWRGNEVIRHENAHPGDAFIVSCFGTEPTLSKMHLPKNPNDFLLFVLGFGNGMRCHDWDSYDAALNAQRSVKLTTDRTEYELVGRHYILNICEDTQGRPYHLAGIITEDLSPSEYFEILLQWPYELRYPHDFLKVAFRKRLFLSNRQIERLFRRWGWNYKA